MYCLETAQQKWRTLPTTTPKRVTEPTLIQEPLTLEECRRQCNLGTENTYHDQDLADILYASRKRVESDTGLVCYTGSFTWKLTEFPEDDYLLFTDIRPVTAITSITYTDTAGATQTWSSANYALDLGNVTPAIHLVYGQYWPVSRGDINGITVTAVAGYASVAAIPPDVKIAVKLAVSLLWAQKMGEDTSKIQQTYDRWIVPLMRGSYP